MVPNHSRSLLAGAVAAMIAACGGGGSRGDAMTAPTLVRGFKVHAGAVDPLPTPPVARSIDIETAACDGTVSAHDTAGFTLTRIFKTARDDYVYTLDYIVNAAANGTDGGNPVDGFKWWNFEYPTLVTSGADAIAIAMHSQ